MWSELSIVAEEEIQTNTNSCSICSDQNFLLLLKKKWRTGEAGWVSFLV
jgi:ribosomal protein S27AE